MDFKQEQAGVDFHTRAIVALEQMKERISVEGICMGDVQFASDIAEHFKLPERVPLRSFTQVPSRTNLSVGTEAVNMTVATGYVALFGIIAAVIAKLISYFLKDGSSSSNGSAGFIATHKKVEKKAEDSVAAATKAEESINSFTREEVDIITAHKKVMETILGEDETPLEYFAKPENRFLRWGLEARLAPDERTKTIMNMIYSNPIQHSPIFGYLSTVNFMPGAVAGISHQLEAFKLFIEEPLTTEQEFFQDLNEISIPGTAFKIIEASTGELFNLMHHLLARMDEKYASVINEINKAHPQIPENNKEDVMEIWFYDMFSCIKLFQLLDDDLFPPVQRGTKPDLFDRTFGVPSHGSKLVDYNTLKTLNPTMELWKTFNARDLVVKSSTDETLQEELNRAGQLITEIKAGKYTVESIPGEASNELKQKKVEHIHYLIKQTDRALTLINQYVVGGTKIIRMYDAVTKSIRLASDFITSYAEKMDKEVVHQAKDKTKPEPTA